MAMVLVLVSPVSAQAMLRAGPEITSVALHPDDPNRIIIRISGLPCEAATSTNAGLSFVAVAEQDVPPDWSTNLTAGTRRYVLVDSLHLFRSDDSGVSWTNTSATSFLREQSRAAVEQKEKWFREEYGSRLPPRSALWHPLFAVFACGYFLITFCLLRRHGALHAILTSLRGLVVLSLVWALLWGFHAVVRNWMDNQYPMAYWNTSGEMHPSPKLGLAMAITALPLPLLAYLVVLWPILPGSAEALVQIFQARRRRIALAVSVVAGIAFALFHLCMMFVGYFWE